MQIRTSAGTSINSKKLPRLYTYLGDRMRNTKFIDIGCGKFIDHLKKFATDHNAVAFFYDPFNRTAAENLEALTGTREEYMNFALCSNVLNVIDSDESVTELIKTVVFFGNGAGYFTVYEGDGTGVGRPTQHGNSWQRNMKLHDYKQFVPDGMQAGFKNGVMIVRRNGHE